MGVFDFVGVAIDGGEVGIRFKRRRIELRQVRGGFNSHIGGLGDEIVVILMTIVCRTP